MKAGPTSCALGPHTVGTFDGCHLCSRGSCSFSSSTIYFPEDEDDDGGGEAQKLLPSVVIVGGWGCGEKAMAAWAPFLASHGIVSMTVGTPKPWTDTPTSRCRALLDASTALQSENDRADSPLHRRLDVSARGVLGYSLGGGGAELAAVEDPTLKCSIAVCPHDGSGHYGVPFPEELSSTVPVLILCSENDREADSQKQAWAHYRKTTGPSLIFEVSGGDHYSAVGPAGGTRKEFDDGAEPCVLFNCCCAVFCGRAPCPIGNLNGPTGHARDEAPRGAIGGVALAWLRLFLSGDESARARLRLDARPDIASGFESNRIER